MCSGFGFVVEAHCCHRRSFCHPSLSKKQNTCNAERNNERCAVAVLFVCSGRCEISKWNFHSYRLYCILIFLSLSPRFLFSFVSLFPHFCCSVFVFTKKPAANSKLGFFPSTSYQVWCTADTRPCDGPLSRLSIFLCGYRCDWRDRKRPSLCCHFNHMFHAFKTTSCCVFSAHRHQASTT